MSIQVSIYFLLLIVLSVMAFITGRSKWLKKSRNKIVIILLRILLIVVICGAGWMRFHPEIEYYLIPGWLVLPFEVIWIFPLAIFFISAGSRMMSTKLASQGLFVLSFLVLIVGLDQSSWIVIGQEINPERFTVDKDGVCIQSTGYTCGAASAVTLLNQYGIQTDELDMARLSHTTWRGVKVVSLALGIAQKAVPQGFKVDILKLDWDGLKRLNQSCIIITKFGFMVDHVVVVLGTGKDGVWIGEPLKGRVKWSKDKFVEKWRGVAIILSQTTGDGENDVRTR